jgi:hypothetical protein
VRSAGPPQKRRGYTLLQMFRENPISVATHYLALTRIRPMIFRFAASMCGFSRSKMMRRFTGEPIYSN